jgi:hypothetical protein
MFVNHWNSKADRHINRIRKAHKANADTLTTDMLEAAADGRIFNADCVDYATMADAIAPVRPFSRGRTIK